jgi:hypothetical protein
MHKTLHSIPQTGTHSLTPYPPCFAHINGVLQQFLCVRAIVNGHREASGWVHPPTRGQDGQPTDGHADGLQSVRGMEKEREQRAAQGKPGGGRGSPQNALVVVLG